MNWERLKKSRWCFIFIVAVLCRLFPMEIAAAGSVLPGAFWQSPEISGAILSASWGDVDGNGAPEIVTVQESRLEILTKNPDGSLTLLATFEANDGERFHRVWVGDFNGDFHVEMVLDGFRGDRPFAKILGWQNGQVIVLQTERAAVAPLFWQGMTRLFRQVGHGRGDWAQDLQELAWNGSRYAANGSTLSLAKGVGGNGVSLYSLTGLGDKLAVFQDDGFLIVMDGNGKQLWRSGLRYGGALDEAAFSGRDPLGINRTGRVILVPRGSWQDRGQTLTVIKNIGFLPSVVGAFANMKASEFAMLEWTEGGFQERKVSPRYDGAISDVSAIDYDGDGLSDELLLVLWSRKGGVLETSRPKTSILTVVPGLGWAYRPAAPVGPPSPSFH